MSDFSDSDDGFDEAFRNLSEDDLTTFNVVSKEIDISNKNDSNLCCTVEIEKTNGVLKLPVLLKDTKVTEKVPDSLISFVQKSKTDFTADVLELKECSYNDENKEPTCVNNRFFPGFTPKAKKRKFPGPAGLLLESQLDHVHPDENSSDANNHSPTLPALDFQNIVSSQFSVEHLSLMSWQKLQSDVSSHPTLLSTARNYSIHQVLKESSKKRLPKYMVVPVLCVLIKSINCKGTNSKSVFIDDTGEIFGNISEDAFALYEKYLLEGTALILKDVIFLFNHLMLKSSNISSIYLSDGTIYHIQNLECILSDNEPSEDMNCGLIMNHSETKNTTCLNSKEKLLSSKDQSLKNFVSVNKMSKIGPKTVSACATHDMNKGMNPVSKMPSYLENYTNDCSVEENLSDDLMDEFDELLGNLDENSILGEI